MISKTIGFRGLANIFRQTHLKPMLLDGLAGDPPFEETGDIKLSPGLDQVTSDVDRPSRSGRAPSGWEMKLLQCLGKLPANSVPGLVNVNKKLMGKIHHAINGNMNTISTGPFSIAMLVHQRVNDVFIIVYYIYIFIFIYLFI